MTPPAPPSHVGIRTDRWKLILFDGLRCSPGFRRSGAAAQIFALYDLERDPRETTDVYTSTSTKVVSKLKRELRAAMACRRRKPRQGRRPPAAGLPHLLAPRPFCLYAIDASVPHRTLARPTSSSA